MALWSKRLDDGSPYPLMSHLLDTSAAAMALWDLWLRPGLKDLIEGSLGSDARSWVAAAAGVHDVGKASPVFAGQLCAKPRAWHEECRRDLVNAGFNIEVPLQLRDQLRRHEKVSAHDLAQGDLEEGDLVSSEWLALSALGHHGRFESLADLRPYERHAKGQWSESRLTARRVVFEACGLEPSGAIPGASPTVAILVAGLVVLADRTASESRGVIEGVSGMTSGVLNLQKPGDWVSSRYEYFSQRLPETLGVYQDFEDARTAVMGGHDLRPLQVAAEEVGRGLWFAMAPTGNGKTEAALLRHAQFSERIIFALPTQATTNAMMKRVQRAFSGTGNVGELAHQLATIEDFYKHPAEVSPSSACEPQPNVFLSEMEHPNSGDLIPSEFLVSGTARLLAPVSIATIDQVLSGALRSKWAHLKLLTLANAHVVIDEAHLMEHYQTSLCKELMAWWGATDTRVSVLTATMSKWQRDAFWDSYQNGGVTSEIQHEYPELHFPSHQLVPAPSQRLDQVGYKIRVTASESEDSVLTHVDWAKRQLASSPHARLGIIVNRIERARRVAELLKGCGKEVIVLHSRMTAGHRRDVADRLLERLGRGADGAGIIVIGTQALEASLDIDLDAMSTDLAPAASLVQRAGRVWRHVDARRCQRLLGAGELPLHVVKSTRKFDWLPYFESELDRVWQFLAPREFLNMPTDSQDFIESTTLKLGEVTLADVDEASSAARRFLAAQSVSVKARDFLDPDAIIQSFAQLTNSDVDENLLTRYIESLGVTVLLIAPQGSAVIPGAWVDSVADLEMISGSDRNSLRRALESSVPVNGKLAALILKQRDESHGGGWSPKASILKRMIPVELDKCKLVYHEVYGLAEKVGPENDLL